MAKAKLGLFDFTMIVISLVIGMGIFKTPAGVAAAVPNPYVFFACWAAGGIIALCGALTYAEIGSRLPATGGYYRIFSYAYHPSVAFGINCIILVSNASSVAGVALIGAEYLGQVIFPPGDRHHGAEIAIAIGCIFIFYIVNLNGLKLSARTQSILTMIKIGLILVLVTPLFFVAHHAAPVTAFHPVHSGWFQYLKAFGVGMVGVSFTYGGYQQTINFGDEVADGNRNLPRGIFIGIAVIIVLYLAINAAYIGVIGFDELKTTKGIGAVMAAHVFGKAAGTVLAVLLFLSVLAYVNVLLMSNPRVMYAMSHDGVLPKIFGRQRASNGALGPSLTVFALMCAFVVFFAGEFERILNFAIFMDCFGFMASAATIFLLRRKKVGPPGKFFTLKGYPLQPVIFILAYLFIAASIFVNQPATALTSLAVLASFVIIYFITRSRKPAL